LKLTHGGARAIKMDNDGQLKLRVYLTMGQRE
jgi:hypothetical protein